MQTPWGDLQVSDAHVHFFSPSFFSSLQTQSGKTPEALSDTLGWQLPASPEELAQSWVRELDRCGVAKAAIIASIPGDEDSVASAVSLFPDRFHGYFLLNPLDPDALARVEHALAGGRLQGICLFPAMHRYSMRDALLKPILRAVLSRPGTVVFVHCGVLTVGVRKKLGLVSSYDMRFSNPIDLHPVALEFPTVNFVVPHFGAGYFREALMLCDLCPNVCLDTSSSNSWIRYQPDDLDLKRVFGKALDVVGPKRLLFGSDSSFFPRGWNSQIFETQSQILWELGIGSADAKLIFGDNLERLLAR